MKITIYELLGMVKDDKVPKNARIRYFDRNNDYYDECNLKENEIINRLHYGNIELNDEVEILDEKKIPEKLYGIVNPKEGTESIPSNEQLMFKINEIIVYLKSKGDE